MRLRGIALHTSTTPTRCSQFPSLVACFAQGARRPRPRRAAAVSWAAPYRSVILPYPSSHVSAVMRGIFSQEATTRPGLCYDGPCEEQVASHDVHSGLLCRIEKGEDGLYTVHYEEEGGKAGSCRAGVVMFGTGRHPNTRDIGLEACPAALPHKGGLFSRTE